MNLLLSIVRNIALLVLISSFWELLAPRGSLRGPVRLVIGLLLVSCVILPITDALARGAKPWQLDLPEQQDNSGQALAAGEEIAGRMQGQAKESYQQDMARQVAAMCLLSEDVRQARAAVEADGNGVLTRVVIEAELTPEADVAGARQRLTQLISTFFSVDVAAIECAIEEAQADEQTIGREP